VAPRDRLFPSFGSAHLHSHLPRALLCSWDTGTRKTKWRHSKWRARWAAAVSHASRPALTIRPASLTMVRAFLAVCPLVCTRRRGGVWYRRLAGCSVTKLSLCRILAPLASQADSRASLPASASRVPLASCVPDLCSFPAAAAWLNFTSQFSLLGTGATGKKAPEACT